MAPLIKVVYATCISNEDLRRDFVTNTLVSKAMLTFLYFITHPLTHTHNLKFQNLEPKQQIEQDPIRHFVLSELP